MEKSEKKGFEGLITSVMRRPEPKIKAAEKKQWVAKFIEMQVRTGMSIEEYIGKPMNWFDNDAIYQLVTEWEEKNQLKLSLNNITSASEMIEANKRMEEMAKDMKGEQKQKK